MRRGSVIITAQEIVDEASVFLESGSYYQATAYDTALLISDSDKYDKFHKFELFNRKILWINQATQELSGIKTPMMARTIFICDKNNFDGHIIAHRFASLLCFVTHGATITPRVWAGTAYPVASVSQPSEKFVGLRIGHQEIDSVINNLRLDTYTDKQWIALAHYRQANIAQTPYYKVLSYWKILELYFNNSDTRINNYINLLYSSRPDIFSDIPAFKGTASRKLRDVRNLSAHFELTGGDVQDPDNPDLFNKADQATFSLRRLAEGLIENTQGW